MRPWREKIPAKINLVRPPGEPSPTGPCYGTPPRRQLWIPWAPDERASALHHLQMATDANSNIPELFIVTHPLSTPKSQNRNKLFLVIGPKTGSGSGSGACCKDDTKKNKTGIRSW